MNKDTEGVTGRHISEGRAIQTEGTEYEGIRRVWCVEEEQRRSNESIRVMESGEK